MCWSPETVNLGLAFLLAASRAKASFSLLSLKVEQMSSSLYGQLCRFTFGFLQGWIFWLWQQVCSCAVGEVWCLAALYLFTWGTSLTWWQHTCFFCRADFCLIEITPLLAGVAAVQMPGLRVPPAEVGTRRRTMVSHGPAPWGAHRGTLCTSSPLPANKEGLFNEHLANKADLKLECLFQEWKFTVKINIFMGSRRKFL